MNSPFKFLFESVSKQEFVEKYFDQKPLIVKGSSDKFKKIFTIDDLNTILNSNELLYPKVRVTDHLNTIHKYDLIYDQDRYTNNINNLLDKKKILLAIARGGTLVFDKIQEHNKNLELFIDTLSSEMCTKINVNAYYTARNKMGVNPHFDRHDVVAIQIHGSKRWYYKKEHHVLSKSMRHQKVPVIDKDMTGWKSVLLEEGDVFYCPRGLWHFTKTEAQHSSHLAIGLYPMSLKAWLENLKDDVQFTELLELYVREPFQPNKSIINAHLVNQLSEILLSKANKPFNYEVNPRPYLELT